MAGVFTFATFTRSLSCCSTRHHIGSLAMWFRKELVLGRLYLLPDSSGNVGVCSRTDTTGVASPDHELKFAGA